MPNHLSKIATYALILTLSLTTTGCSAIPPQNNTSTPQVSQAVQQDVQYKSIVKMDKVTSSNNQLKSMLQQMDKQTNDLKEYLTGNHTQAQKASLYSLYLNNMYLYDKYLSEKFEIGEEANYADYNMNRRKFTAYGLDFAYDDHKVYLDDYSLSNSLIAIKYKGEGTFVPEFDMYYQAMTFSKYLSPAWQDYLAICARESQYLQDVVFSMYGPGDYTTVNMYELGYWIKCWSDFLIKYPDFSMNNKITENLDLYTKYYISPLQNDFDDTRALSKDRQIEFNSLLQSLNKSAEVYRTLDKAYSLLKANNFKANKEYNKLYESYEKYSRY